MQPMDMEPLIVFFWTLVAVITVIAMSFRHLSQRNRVALLRNLVEKGQPIPTGLFSEEPRRWDHRGFMVAGILLIGMAVATALFGWAVGSMLGETVTTAKGVVREKNNYVLFLSLFPLCLGGASIVAGRYLRAHG
jgi:hypothetical protein